MKKDGEHNHHSHLASINLLPVEPVASMSQLPPVVPARIHLSAKDAPANAVVASVKPTNIFYRPLNHSSAQKFSGALSKPAKAVYPEVQAARDLADRLEVTKNALNLKKLEALKKHCAFVEASKPYAAAVAATTSIVEVPEPSPELQHRLKTPTPEDYEAWDCKQKRKAAKR